MKSLEIDFEIKLPNEYREFLLKYNFCKVDPKDFDFTLPNENIEGSSIDFFYGLNTNKDNLYQSLRFAYSTFQGRMPAVFKPIGSDPFGNQIIINLEHGSIWFWDHEMEMDEGKEPTMENIYFITPNFNLFLNSLYEFITPE